MTAALCVCLALCVFLIFRQVKMGRENASLKSVCELTNVQLTDQNARYDNLAEQITRQSKIHHDYINQNQAACSLIAAGCAEEALAILVNQRDVLANSKIFVYCKNRIADAVITNKVSVAQTENIQVNVSVSLPQETPLANLDICNLFSNILDNAVRSCKEGKNLAPVINLACAERGGYLIIKCGNTKTNEVSTTGGGVQTSKQNKRGHGYGIKIVEELAEKYGGRCVISFDSGYFEIVVYIPWP